MVTRHVKNRLNRRIFQANHLTPGNTCGRVHWIMCEHGLPFGDAQRAQRKLRTGAFAVNMTASEPETGDVRTWFGWSGGQITVGFN